MAPNNNGNGTAHNSHPFAGFSDPLVLHKLSQLTQNDVGPFTSFASMSRQSLGYQSLLDPRRSIDDECGYPHTETAIDANLYRMLYDRENIPNRVVEVWPRESWQNQPTVYESEDPKEITDFEIAWDGIASDLQGVNSWYHNEQGSNLWEKLERADIISGIGHFGIILLLVNDGRNFQEPIDGSVMAINRGIPDCYMTKEEEEKIRSGIFNSGSTSTTSFDTRSVEKQYPSLNKLEKQAVEREVQYRTSILNAYKTEDPAVVKDQGYLKPQGLVQGTDLNYDPGTAVGMPAPESFGGSVGYSLSGTDQQYFGIISGISEQFKPKPTKKNVLLGMTPYPEDLVQIVRYEWNIRNPRFGLPVMYRVTLNDPREIHSGIGLPLATVFVHWSRVIHIADNLRTSNIFGVPRMRPVLNRLLDLRKLYSGGAEGVWKGISPGLSFETHPQLGGDVIVDEENMKRVVNDYQNSLQRYLIGRGGSWKPIVPTMIDPSPIIEKQIEAVCITLAVPVRVFKGSERGELASSQDDSKMNDRIVKRQNFQTTPYLITPLVDRLIQIGVLPIPKSGPNSDSQQTPRESEPTSDYANSQTKKQDDEADASKPAPQQDTVPSQNQRRLISMRKSGKYVVQRSGKGFIVTNKDNGQQTFESDAGWSCKWPDIDSTSDKDKAGIIQTKTAALVSYAGSPAPHVMPPHNYFTEIWGMDDDAVESMLDDAEASQDDPIVEALAGQNQPPMPPGFDPSDPNSMPELDENGEPIDPSSIPQETGVNEEDQEIDPDTGLPVSNEWSEAAREAALEARRQKVGILSRIKTAAHAGLYKAAEIAAHPAVHHAILEKAHNFALEQATKGFEQHTHVPYMLAAKLISKHLPRVLGFAKRKLTGNELDVLTMNINDPLKDFTPEQIHDAVHKMTQVIYHCLGVKDPVDKEALREFLEREKEKKPTKNATEEQFLLNADGTLALVLHGGPGSGNFGHSGRPGQVGGSGEGLPADKIPMSPKFLTSKKDIAEQNQTAIKQMQEHAKAGNLHDLMVHPGTASPKVQDYKESLIKALKDHQKEQDILKSLKESLTQSHKEQETLQLPNPATLTHVKDLPGSTHPILAKDPNGKLWVVKSSNNEHHLRNEADADAAYRAAGVPVAKSGIVDTPTGIKKISEYIEGGKTLSEWEKDKSKPEIESMHKEIAKHMAADALLANWDAIGLTKDNVLITKEGKPVRIDNGGALLYRAQGQPKGTKFNGDVSELKSLKDPVLNPTSAEVFKHLSDHEIRTQMIDLLKKKDAILAAVKDPQAHDIMKERFNTFTKILSKPADVPVPIAQKIAAFDPNEPGWPGTPPIVPTATQTKSLHTGTLLAEHIKATVPGVSETHLLKLAHANPQGVHGDKIKIVPAANYAPKTAAKLLAQQEAIQKALESVAPPGALFAMPKASPNAKKLGLTQTIGTEGTFHTETAKEAATHLDTHIETPKEAAAKESYHEAKAKGTIVAEHGVIPAKYGNHPVLKSDNKEVITLPVGNLYDEKLHQKWMATLTYKEQSVIGEWKSSSTGIRNSVASGNPSEPTAKAFMNAITRSQLHEGITYRGLHNNGPGDKAYADKIIEQIEKAGVGGTWTDAAPHNMSLNSETGVDFTEGHGGEHALLLRIVTKTGRPDDKVNNYSHEQEIIGMPKTVYRINAIHKNVKIRGVDSFGKAGMTRTIKRIIDIEEIV